MENVNTLDDFDDHIPIVKVTRAEFVIYLALSCSRDNLRKMRLISFILDINVYAMNAHTPCDVNVLDVSCKVTPDIFVFDFLESDI